jgi:hypothetical protein
MPDAIMPDQRFLELCRLITAEKDPRKLVALTEELTELLAEEQDVIKAKIRANIGNTTIPE